MSDGNAERQVAIASLSRPAPRSAWSSDVLSTTADTPALLSSLRPFVDYAQGLALRALQGIRFDDLHLRADADQALDQPLDFALYCSARSRRQRSGDIGTPLYQDIEFIEVTIAAHFEDIVCRKARLLYDNLHDLRRKDVDTSNDKHVVAAAGDPRHAPHGARRAGQQSGEVARAVADDRHADLGQRRDDQLADFVIGQNRAGFRIDDLGIEVVFPDREAVARFYAFGRDTGAD